MPHSPPTLRAATTDDQTSIVELCKTSLTTIYGTFMAPERMRPWVEGNEVEDYVRRMWPCMTVAVWHDAVVGVVAVDGRVIDLLWVRDDVRRRGVGSTLINRAESVIFTTHEEAELECFAPNRMGLTFYRARGYRTIRRYYEAASGVDKVVMRKPFAAPVQTLSRRRWSFWSPTGAG